MVNNKTEMKKKGVLEAKRFIIKCYVEFFWILTQTNQKNKTHENQRNMLNV